MKHLLPAGETEREARVLMSVHKLYWTVRDALVSWGLIDRPRFYMQRYPAGEIRDRLAGRGSCRRLRRMSLRRLLNS